MLKKTRVMLAASLEKSGAWSAQGETLTIPFPSNWELDIVSKEIPTIAAKIRDLFGMEFRISLTLGQAPKPKAEEGQRPAAAVSAADDADPVKIVARLFKGSVIAERELGGSE
jgi:hypothetical protein